MTIFIMSIGAAIGTIMVLYKLGLVRAASRNRLIDGALDFFVSGMLVFIFAGSFMGASVGIIAGLMVSFYLLAVRLWRKRMRPSLPTDTASWSEWEVLPDVE